MGSLKSLALAGVFAAASSASRSRPICSRRLRRCIIRRRRSSSRRLVPARRRRRQLLRDNGTFSSPDQPPAVFFGEDLGAGAFAGVGIGYQFNGWLRADLTGEYRVSKGFKVFDRIDFVGAGGVPGVTHETTHGDFTSAVLLLNGYVDFGTWYGITPFVGAGVGFARNMLSGFSDTSLTTIAGVTTAERRLASANGDKTNFAWALHAGLGYSVTPNLKLEVGLPLPQPRRGGDGHARTASAARPSRRSRSRRSTRTTSRSASAGCSRRRRRRSTTRRSSASTERRQNRSERRGELPAPFSFWERRLRLIAPCRAPAAHR